MIREGFLEEDAFGQGRAGNGERRGQSRVQAPQDGRCQEEGELR